MKTASSISLIGAFRKDFSVRIIHQIENANAYSYLKFYNTISDNVDFFPLGLTIGIELCAITAAKEYKITDSNVEVDAFKNILKELFREVNAYGSYSLKPSRIVFKPSGNPVKSEVRRLSRNKVLLAFSGGKESIVQLNLLLLKGYDVSIFLINDGSRTWQNLRKWEDFFNRSRIKVIKAYFKNSFNGERESFGNIFYSSYLIGQIIALTYLMAQEFGIGKISLGLEAVNDDGISFWRKKQFNHLYQKSTKHVNELMLFLNTYFDKELKFVNLINRKSDKEVLDLVAGVNPEISSMISVCGSSNYLSLNCSRCSKCIYVMVTMLGHDNCKEIAKKIFNTKSFFNNPIPYIRPWFDHRFKPPIGCIGPSDFFFESLLNLANRESFQVDLKKWLANKEIRQINNRLR